MPANTFDKEKVLRDYRIGYLSRQASLIGRKEVLTGKAKFGIFGDGKELPQLAMANVFAKGDFRSGYYRDQTFMFALGISSLEAFFAQLYANPDLALEPASGGRQMNCHFSTRLLNDDGTWKNLTELYNSAADLSPVSSQMPRLVGLAQASKLYRQLDELASMTRFSNRGNEVAFGTIGNAGCAEGMFWEAVNAVGVLQSPMVLSIWDDGYGISVPGSHQIAKNDLTAVLSGFRREPGKTNGFDLYTVDGWDYPALNETYEMAAATARSEHVPAIIHVVDVTQPQGHSTSGSHERYKSKERLAWEVEFDGLTRMRAWMIDAKLATDAELTLLEKSALDEVRQKQREAWSAFTEPILAERQSVIDLAEAIGPGSAQAAAVAAAIAELKQLPTPQRRNIHATAREVLLLARDGDHGHRRKLIDWVQEQDRINQDRYSSHLHSQSAESALQVVEVPATYAADAPSLNGYEVLNHAFDAAFARMPQLVAFGEDVGFLGDVNQGLAGMQKKYGELRVSDTGIRECTIAGQAIGLALRGIRPIAEMQYLDYINYALQILSDDLASLQYRTRGGQKAPVIIRTRGHRLEGIWHSGSPMSGILGLLRGIWVCVPRNMTQAAGFYNTLLKSDDSAVIIEVLNGYRQKEQLPSNIGEMTIPLGVPEILRAGTDVTLVTYGACCTVAMTAAASLQRAGIEVEVIDARTLLPFDTAGAIVRSLEKTNRVVFLDEDVPGGASAYMLQQIIEVQHGYDWLDAEPRTVSAKPHRPAYGSDGDYWSKPNPETVFDAVYELMHEARPDQFPLFYR